MLSSQTRFVVRVFLNDIFYMDIKIGLYCLWFRCHSWNIFYRMLFIYLSICFCGKDQYPIKLSYTLHRFNFTSYNEVK